MLRVSASSVYRLWVNGQFSGYGPARAPHGYFRIDTWFLQKLLKAGSNVLAIEVAGYNVNSYYLLDQPAFLCAEVIQGLRCLKATSADANDFTAYDLSHRVRRVPRYSFQRPFSEVYRCDTDCDVWRHESQKTRTTLKCEARPDGRWLPRRWPYPAFEVLPVDRTIAMGTLKPASSPQDPYKDRSLIAIGPALRGFLESELDAVPSLELQNFTSRLESDATASTDRFTLHTGEQSIFDLSVNRTGFVGFSVSCEQPSQLVILFDELLTDGDIDFTRADCANIVQWDLMPGRYTLETFEPYTLRYLKVAVLNGACEMVDLFIREYISPVGRDAHYVGNDSKLREVFDAAIETFRQNAVDLFTDCPSRERAGWLCDSFFIARVAHGLTGSTEMETAFLENYLLPDSFAHLPDGMLPMCYPADHDNGMFIPQWPMWLVLQLEEYEQRGGSPELVVAFESKVIGLFDYFSRFRNEHGLLEKLDSWNFIEWSKANEFVDDVNYPTNMLYAGALSTAGRLYGRSDWIEQSHELVTSIREQSWNGAFFIDNAVRCESKLVRTDNRTEACQYFAFYFNIATRQTHLQLWETLLERFTPDTVPHTSIANVCPANMLVGHYLRLDLLDRFGLGNRLLAEAKSFLGGMAQRTGTLWENDQPSASCNHGFASCVIYWIKRWAEVSLDTKCANQTVSNR